jgi:hypothetical protein
MYESIVTVPGYINRNLQRIIGQANTDTFVLRCGKCTTEYGCTLRQIPERL